MPRPLARPLWLALPILIASGASTQSPAAALASDGVVVHGVVGFRDGMAETAAPDVWAVIAPEPLDAAVVVRESVARLATLVQCRGLGLRFQSSATSVPVLLSALERVVTHRVGNASTFTELGDVTVALHATLEFFAFRARDTGVGISEAFLPELFEAFGQESNGHGRSFEGTGLALAIPKRLADRVGGEIRVWSRRGEGTLFEVALPIEAPSAAPLLDPPVIPQIALPVSPAPEDDGSAPAELPSAPLSAA